MHSTVHNPQKSSPEVKIFFLFAEYQCRSPVCFYCSFVKKVLKLLTTGSEDCYYTGIEKNM